MIISTRRHRAKAWLLMAMLVAFVLVLTVHRNGQHQHASLLTDLGQLSGAFGDTLGSIGAYGGLYIASSTTDNRDAGRSSSTASKPVRGGSPPSDAMLAFWRELWDTLVDARPNTVETVHLVDSLTDHDMEPDPDVEPDPDRRRVDMAHLSDSLREELYVAHARYFKAARELGMRLPYDVGETGGQPDRARLAGRKKESKTTAAAAASTPSPTPSPSRGIVMTAGGPYVGIAVTSLLMLRRSGSQLPVQVFLDGDADYDESLCEDVFPRLGASCRVMERFWEATPQMAPLSRFQFKVFAILLSSFRQVLFLDADCWPVRSPDALFDAEPFAGRGLVTWPDFWLSTSSPALYGVDGILAIAEPPLTARRSSESGILLYDKARQATSLLLAAYYNFYGPDYYYPLLSQGAVGQGDKETFVHGALVAGTPFYDVRTPIGILGRWVNGTYMAAAMRQADPAEDYALVQQANMANTTNPVKARPLFVHHNLVKIDIRQLGRSMERVYAVDATQGLTRLWQVDTDFLDGVGYDVEKALWAEVLQALCDRQQQPPATPSRECTDLQQYYLCVFG